MLWPIQLLLYLLIINMNSISCWRGWRLTSWWWGKGKETPPEDTVVTSDTAPHLTNCLSPVCLMKCISVDDLGTLCSLSRWTYCLPHAVEQSFEYVHPCNFWSGSSSCCWYNTAAVRGFCEPVVTLNEVGCNTEVITNCDEGGCPQQPWKATSQQHPYPLLQ